MDTRICVVSFSLAGLMSIGGAAAGQHEGHPAGAAVATPSAAQVTQCRQAQPVIVGLLDAGLKRLEEARLTNSPAAMRDAADDVQAALVDARTQLAPCAEMQMATTDVVAGHTMPAAPSTAGAAVPEPHAAHVVPSATPKPAPARPVAATHAGHAAVTPKPSETANTHAEHVDADTSLSADSSPTELTTPENPAARLADLTCQPRVDPDRAPRATYLGKAYYFCTAADRDAFLKAPAKYLQR